MQVVASWPFGLVLLWVIAIGLFALGAWQVAEAFQVREPDRRKRWGRRIKFVGIALAYAAIAVSAMISALGGRTDSDQSARALSAQLLAAPGGVVVLVLIGLGIAGVGAAFVIGGATRSFEQDLDLPAAGAPRTLVLAIGTVGYFAKGLAVAVVGVLIVLAAVTADPVTAGGLDATLKRLADLSFGDFVLWFIGAGLAVYGAFCFVRTRYGRW
jgi:hypothetical protein